MDWVNRSKIGNIFKNILLAFDDITTLNGVFTRDFTDDRVKVLIGDELDVQILQECSIVFSEFNVYRGERAILAVIGPKRLRFSQVIPLVRRSKDIVQKLILGWE